MPAKPIVRVSSVADQPSQRFLDTFYDTHTKRPRFPNGRPWWGNRQFPANQGNVAGFIDLYPGEYIEGQTVLDATHRTWDAPFMPETRFAQFDYNRKIIRWRYDRMFGEDMAAYDKHYAAAAAIAQSQSGMAIPKYGEPLGREIQFILGPTPRSPKIAQALIAGDPWLLGFIDEPNVELAKLLGLNESEARLSMRTQVNEWSQRQAMGLSDDEDLPMKGVLTANDVISMLDKRDAQLATVVADILDRREAERQAAKDRANRQRSETVKKNLEKARAELKKKRESQPQTQPPAEPVRESADPFADAFAE